MLCTIFGGINPLILERNQKRNTFTDRRMPEKSDQNSSLELTAEVRKKSWSWET